MRFKHYFLTESRTGLDNWNAHWKDKPDNFQTYFRKDTNIYNKDDEPTKVKSTEEVFVFPKKGIYKPKSKGNSAWVWVKYNGKEYISSIDAIEKFPVASDEGFTGVRDLSQLIQGSKKENIKYLGQDISTNVFNSYEEIEKIFKDNVKKTKHGQAINDIFTEIITHPKNIDWEKLGLKNKPAVINNIGKYMGELLIGYFILKDPHNENMFTGAKFIKPDEKAKKVFTPVSSNFETIDSLIELDNGSIVPFSSKYGAGAGAAFYPGIARKLATDKMKDEVDKSTMLKKLISYYVAGKGPVEISYLYMVNDLMKKKFNAEEIFKDLKTGKSNDFTKLSKETKEFLKELEQYEFKNPISKKYISNLPATATYMINNEIAYLMNTDENIMKAALTAMGSEKYYQARIKDNNFRSGSLGFQISIAGENEMEIIGNKSSPKDITATNGNISYKIK